MNWDPSIYKVRKITAGRWYILHVCTRVSVFTCEQNDDVHHFLINYLEENIVLSQEKKQRVLGDVIIWKPGTNIHPERQFLPLPVQMMTSVAAEILMDCMSSVIFVSLFLMIGLVQGHPVSVSTSVLHTELHSASPQTSLLSLVTCFQQRPFQERPKTL